MLSQPAQLLGLKQGQESRGTLFLPEVRGPGGRKPTRSDSSTIRGRTVLSCSPMPTGLSARPMTKTAASKAHFLRDPCAFQKHQLCRTLWQKQKEIIHAVETSPLVAVKGCHASGKTFAAAGLPLWWLVRYLTGKVFTTAPTLRQVKTILEGHRGSPTGRSRQTTAAGAHQHGARHQPIAIRLRRQFIGGY